MKVLCYCPKPNVGGGVRLFSQLIPAIAKHSAIDLLTVLTHDPSIQDIFDFETQLIKSINIVVVPIPLIIQWLYESKKETFMGAHVIRCILRRFIFRKNINLLSRWQIKTIETFAEQNDLVYFFCPHFQECPNIQKPIVCTFQDTIVLDFPELIGGIETWREWLRSKIWIEKSWVVVSSVNTKKRLISHFENSINLLSKISHATLPWKRTLLSNSKNVNKEILDISQKDYILYPANINAHKNHYNLLIALSRLPEEKRIPLVLTGAWTELLNKSKLDWPDIELQQAVRLLGLIERLGLKQGKDFYALGYINDEDAFTLLQNAKALIMPSLAEGGGSYPVEEALTLGVPVLCSDIPVMREHLSTWPTKIAWFDPYSPDSIVVALKEMMDNYEIYKQSAVDNMNTPRQSWDEIAAQYIEVFKMSINECKVN